MRKVWKPFAAGEGIRIFAWALFLGQGAGPLVFGPMIHMLGFAGAFLVVALGLGLLGQVVVRRVVRTTQQAAPARA